MKLTNLTENFTREELACKHCGRMHIPQSSIDSLQRLRNRFGKPMRITSGDRCPVYNQQVSTTGPNGPHTKAAFDINVWGKEAYEIVRLALNEGFTGIGVHQKGPHEKRFIHLDALPEDEGQPRPFIWSY